MVVPRLSPLAALSILLIGVLVASALADDKVRPNHRPVKAVGDARAVLAGGGVLPVYLTADWSRPLPDITRAVIVLHGLLRNADVYFASAKRTQAAAGEAGRKTLTPTPTSRRATRAAWARRRAPTATCVATPMWIT